MTRRPIPTRIISIAAISACCALSALPPRAYAQSAEAEGLFEDGERLFAAGKLAEACDAYEASNRIEARAGTLIRLGECRERNSQIASAWSAFKDALARAKDPVKRDLAKRKVAQLEPTVSHLSVIVAETRRVTDLAITRNGKPVDSGTWNHSLPIDGGSYTIASHATGFRDWTTTVVVATTGADIKVELPELEPVTAAKPDPTQPDHGGPPDAHPDDHNKVDVVPAPRTRVIPLALTGGAIALAGGALGFELWGEHIYDRAKSDPSPSNQLSLWHSANLRRYIAEGMLGGAIASGAIATWFWLRGDSGSPTREHSAHVVPMVTPGGSGLVVVGGF